MRTFRSVASHGSNPPSNGSSGEATPRLHALTGVRILAALAVYASHIQPPHGAPTAVRTFLESGYMGVTLFFTLSGFVLAINYFERLRRPNRHAIREFAVARFARIYPLYILILAYNIVAQHAYGASIKGWWEHVLAIQAWDPNVFQVFNFNGPAWSVSVEVFLYACFPLLVLMLALLRTPRRLLIAAAATVLCMAALALWFTLSGRSDLAWANPESAHRWLYLTPLTRLGDFVLGIIAARLYVKSRGNLRLERAGGPLALAAVIAIVALMSWTANFYSAWSWDLAYALPSVVLIFGLAIAPRSRPSRLLSLPLVVLLGESSYAFYLVHQRALEDFGAGRWAIATSPTTITFEAFTLGAIICLAVGLHVMIERPARLYIRRLLGSYRGPVANPAAVAEPDAAVATRAQRAII
jgi:peptidoglycan/LPS O-acetylase OafA/YrhL